MQPFGDARGELAFVFQVAIDEKIFPIGIVLHGGDAVFGDLGKDQFDAVASRSRAWVGNILLERGHRGIFFEHAGEFAVWRRARIRRLWDWECLS